MSTSPEARTQVVLRALRALLRPLARLVIAEQVPFPSLAELWKSVLVEEAERSFRLPDKPLTDSRITLLTGVHRKEVRRLRRGAPDPEDEAPRVSLGARLIADWNALPRFLDENGEPLPLYRTSGRGGPSVRDLAETAGRDIRPQALVDEWLRQGVVEIDQENRIRLRHDAFVPEHDFEERMRFFGRNLGEHVAASVHNVQGGDPPQLDQAVYYGGLSESSASQLGRRARELGLRALRALNREAHALQEQDRGRPGADHRIHFGAYFNRNRRATQEQEPSDD